MHKTGNEGLELNSKKDYRRWNVFGFAWDNCHPQFPNKINDDDFDAHCAGCVEFG
jgi:hypothetical protein